MHLAISAASTLLLNLFSIYCDGFRAQASRLKVVNVLSRFGDVFANADVEVGVSIDFADFHFNVLVHMSNWEFIIFILEAQNGVVERNSFLNDDFAAELVSATYYAIT